MQTRLQQFQAIRADDGTSFSNLYASVTALSTSEFDLAPFDVSPLGDRAVVIAQDLANVLASQLTAANHRVGAAVNAALASADAQASPAGRVAALLEASKALFGDDFQNDPGIRRLSGSGLGVEQRAQRVQLRQFPFYLRDQYLESRVSSR